MYLEKAKQRYQDLNQLLNRDNDVKPCTPDQVSSLEQHLGLSIPKVHQEFLLWMGQGSKYFDSDNCRLSDVWDGRETATEIMEEFNFSGALSC
ncbi:SMI1/KNR4 family protein [Kovacikia minuta CCNUW1]|uniref:SMI1/KNR4 family protein n=1 Tax=Kovacikia minuta TaxID=2931930 RepID=UPI001CCF6E71|nr:SMI1/KNR4 family protein [Kovacikia minuta]UBF29093.1 SMI1/KNR4 family protein [Kovacikia minuta CCNUW1]